MNLPSLIPLVSAACFAFVLSACDSGTGESSGSGGAPPAADAGGAAGSFQVFVSNNKASQRAEMTVTADTTFGEVRSFAESELGLAGQEFRLMVAGKYPEDGEKLGDHGFQPHDPPSGMPVGNIVVRVKD